MRINHRGDTIPKTPFLIQAYSKIAIFSKMFPNQRQRQIAKANNRKGAHRRAPSMRSIFISSIKCVLWAIAGEEAILENALHVVHGPCKMEKDVRTYVFCHDFFDLDSE
jgi:hypothetical protein